ncbi:hypothetical protein FBU30_009926 [Linnemannia zychae]|nr:hypothetical protein FBU30_009926 [Linnemannia zychae]
MTETSNHGNGFTHHPQQQHLQQQHYEAKLGPGISATASAMSRSKVLKSKALMEAQAAVKSDNDGDVQEALEAYGRAVALLDKVMTGGITSEEHERIQAITATVF